MKRLLCHLLLFLCLGTVVQAEPLVTEYFIIDMPDTWQRDSEQSASSVSIAVYATKNRDTVLTTILGTNGGASVDTITSCFAQQYKATGKPSVKNGQGSFAFTSYDGVESTGYVTVQDSLYMAVTVSGSLRKARAFMKTFSSSDYAGLIPSF